MQTIITPHKHLKYVVAIAIALFCVIFTVVVTRASIVHGVGVNERIITVHDDGVDKGFVTDKNTVREALKDAGIRLDSRDRTEPGLDEKLIANSYQVNIYRARPVLIRDGIHEVTVITAYRTSGQIAQDAGITLQKEDIVKLSPSSDPIAEGAAEVMTITRAIPFTFVFYGKTEQAYTQARTIGDMLKAKHIAMDDADRTDVALSTDLTAGMTVRLWREGVQTITVDEEVPFATKSIQDTDQPTGYRKVQAEGKNGKRTVTYEITTQNGIEVARKEINSVTTQEAVAEEVIVGVKSNGGLTQSKGVNLFTDSNGVTHRETYYDLNMSVVVRFCGGTYSVRADGVKVDQDGYILIAANLARYPRCSVVETSLGLAKVYDTGGFVSTYPDGYDIATDWTNRNGI